MKYSLSILILFVFFFGCKGEPGPAGPTLSGNIVGKAFLYADNGQPFQDNSGIKVSIDGSSYSTMSSFDGSWELEGIPTGIYILIFSKKGFATLKQYNFQFVGGGTYAYGTRNIGQIPNVTIKNLKLTQQDGEKYTIQFSISSADSLFRGGFINYDKNPISASPTTSWSFSEYFIIQPDSVFFSRELEYIEHYKTEYNLSSGSKLYLRVFLLPHSGEVVNYNPFNNKNEIYDYENALSQLDSLIVP